MVFFKWLATIPIYHYSNVYLLFKVSFKARTYIVFPNCIPEVKISIISRLVLCDSLWLVKLDKINKRKNTPTMVILDKMGTLRLLYPK